MVLTHVQGTHTKSASNFYTKRAKIKKINMFPIKTQVKQHMVTLYKKHGKGISSMWTLLMSSIFIEFCSRCHVVLWALNKCSCYHMHYKAMLQHVPSTIIAIYFPLKITTNPLLLNVRDRHWHEAALLHEAKAFKARALLWFRLHDSAKGSASLWLRGLQKNEASNQGFMV